MSDFWMVLVFGILLCAFTIAAILDITSLLDITSYSDNELIECNENLQWCEKEFPNRYNIIVELKKETNGEE